jgi:hypothetical protein
MWRGPVADVVSASALALAVMTAAARTARSEERAATVADAAPSGSPPRGGAADAGVVVIDKDGGGKQFRFTETDVEGRRRAPELVYFLRRVRAEFAAGDLGHRSFLRELSDTRRDSHF